MRIIIAPDSFKGSLSSRQIIDITREEALLAFPHAQIIGLPLADGGEGTIEALLSSLDGELRHVRVSGPLFEPEEAYYGVLSTGEAVIESAAACGLPMIPFEQRNPMCTTSTGVGELIADALKSGNNKILIGLGGSATVDGGLGALSALGVQFLDEYGEAVRPTGSGMGKVRDVRLGGLVSLAREAEITILSDVTNPLTGLSGAAHIFGPQKGATSEMVLELDAGMAHMCKVVQNKTGRNMAALPGAGAAGGLGGALNALLGAKIRSGIDTILELIHFDEYLHEADLIITGEGCVDGQTSGGKTLSGVVHRATVTGVPVIALAGGLGPGAESLRQAGLCELFPITRGPITLDESIANAETLLRDATGRLFGLLAIARNLK